MLSAHAAATQRLLCLCPQVADSARLKITHGSRVIENGMKVSPDSLLDVSLGEAEASGMCRRTATVRRGGAGERVTSLQWFQPYITAISIGCGCLSLSLGAPCPPGAAGAGGVDRRVGDLHPPPGEQARLVRQQAGPLSPLGQGPWGWWAGVTDAFPPLPLLMSHTSPAALVGTPLTLLHLPRSLAGTTQHRYHSRLPIFMLPIPLLHPHHPTSVSHNPLHGIMSPAGSMDLKCNRSINHPTPSLLPFRRNAPHAPPSPSPLTGGPRRPHPQEPAVPVMAAHAGHQHPGQRREATRERKAALPDRLHPRGCPLPAAEAALRVPHRSLPLCALPTVQPVPCCHAHPAAMPVLPPVSCLLPCCR